jgi:hypothetical protein
MFCLTTTTLHIALESFTNWMLTEGLKDLLIPSFGLRLDHVDMGQAPPMQLTHDFELIAPLGLMPWSTVA